MNKTTLIVILAVVFALAGFYVYKNIASKGPITPEDKTVISTVQPTVSLSPVFAKLSVWVPGATWGTPRATVEDTSYGKVPGMSVEGEMKGQNKSIRRNYEDQDLMKSWGYKEDMSFAADGPGASNWGYSKVENGKMQVVVFGYSSNRLLGPESKEPPFVSLSVFVSDPFVKK
ncbi:hypothetical protein HZC27_04570 [Candidatus Roizmanbacteria bacterium]|nr:hypothetical protein [Candidatus Roizmanbacteria bacterium]